MVFFDDFMEKLQTTISESVAPVVDMQTELSGLGEKIAERVGKLTAVNMKLAASQASLAAANI